MNKFSNFVSQQNVKSKNRLEVEGVSYEIAFNFTSKRTEASSRANEQPKFRLVARTQAEEDAYNCVDHRVVEKPTGVVASVAHLVKGALGAGVLSAHVGFKTCGYLVGTLISIFSACYLCYCLYILVKSAQVLYKRCHVPTMTYPDVGEAACACSSNPKIAKFSKTFRYLIDALICIDLFGSCATYQIIVAKSVKQLVENVQYSTMEGLNGLPSLRVYLAILVVPTVLICLIRHLKWLAPLSFVANMVILFCIVVAIHYAFQYNPTFSNMVPRTTLYEFFQFTGVSAFSLSCIGVVLPVENNMKDPRNYGLALIIAYMFIFGGVYCIAFFGYVAFLDKCESPITVNFPLNTLGKVLKGFIVIMVFATHALNFWVPFNTVFIYLKNLHDPQKLLMWEMIYRAVFVVIIAVVAIIFPTITHLMGFLGAFCLSNIAFIYPNLIHLMVIWERPGLGIYKWRLYFAIVMIIIGIFLGICGSIVSMTELIKVAIA